MIAVEVPQNKEISGGGKNGERKGVGSGIRWKGANMGGVHIKKRERGGLVKREVDTYIIRVGIKRRKKSRKFRERYALLDENDNAAASVHVIRERMPDREWVRSER